MLVETEEQPSKKPREDAYRKPMWARFLAVAICVQFCTGAAAQDVDWRAAEAAFKEQHEKWNQQFTKGLPACGIPSHLKKFMLDWYTKFKEGDCTGGDALRSGRPRLIPVEVAKRAADILKKGRLVKVKHGKHTCHKLVYYPTLADAIADNEELRNILTDNQVTPDQLREAMHAADASLVRRRLTFKRVLSPSEKADRVATAEKLLQRLQNEPDFLEHMVFIDETSIVLFGEDKEALHVWCDKHDVHFHDVCPVPEHAKHKTIKVHLIAAVASHPAFAEKNGLVYVEMTTGTTGIKRRTNKRGDDGRTDISYEYPVSNYTLLNSMIPAYFCVAANCTPTLAAHCFSASTYFTSCPCQVIS